MATDCTTADMYQSLNWCDGQTVLPGIRPKVFFQKKSNIAAWPTLPKLGEAKKWVNWPPTRVILRWRRIRSG